MSGSDRGPTRIFAIAAVLLATAAASVRDTPVRERAMGRGQADAGRVVRLPLTATSLELHDGKIDVRAGRSLEGTLDLLEVDVLELATPVVADRGAQEVVRKASLALLEGTSRTAQTTQRRLGRTFSGYLWMLAGTFAVGIGGAIATLYQGFTADSSEDVATTAIFGGLSAASFFSLFLLKPVEAMDRAGPHSAWLLAIVNTYWTKLAYFQDPRSAVADLNEAQERMEASFIRYLEHTAPPARRQPEDPGTDRPADGAQATDPRRS